MAKSKTSKSTKQISIDVEARTKKLTKDAQSAIAMREKLNIRFTDSEILRIQKAAEQSKKRVMPMLRKWVLDALEDYEAQQAGGTIQTINPTRVGKPLYVRESLDRHSENLYDQAPALYDQTPASSVEARLAALEFLMSQIAAQLNNKEKK